MDAIYCVDDFEMNEHISLTGKKSIDSGIGSPTLPDLVSLDILTESSKRTAFHVLEDLTLVLGIEQGVCGPFGGLSHGPIPDA